MYYGDVIDYHTHIWPHSHSLEKSPSISVELLERYCDYAHEVNVSEIAVTEHLFRFKQAFELLNGWWEESDSADQDVALLQESMKRYFLEHAVYDLDEYVDCIQTAQKKGLPVLAGLEVDYYKNRMDDISTLVGGYPFDVLLGSIHWLGAWRFDDLDDQLSMDKWDTANLGQVWNSYVRAVEELADSGVCDVLAHPDLPKVVGDKGKLDDNSGSSEMSNNLWERIAKALSSSHMAAEVSSAGWRKPAAEAYPNVELLKQLFLLKVPVTTASDAHVLADIGKDFSKLRVLLDNIGYKSVTRFSKREGFSHPLER